MNIHNLKEKLDEYSGAYFDRFHIGDRGSIEKYKVDLEAEGLSPGRV